MPMKPARPCTHPGCPKLTTSGRCEDHKRKAWDNPKSASKRTTGRRLQRERDRLFNAQPLCVECLKRGHDRVATIRDHIIPLAEGGLDVWENTQGLCQECSDRKTAEEAKRGAGRILGR